MDVQPVTRDEMRLGGPKLVRCLGHHDGGTMLHKID